MEQTNPKYYNKDFINMFLCDSMLFTLCSNEKNTYPKKTTMKCSDLMGGEVITSSSMFLDSHVVIFNYIVNPI